MGALAAPGRRINRGGRKVDPSIDLPAGRHKVDPAQLRRHTQGTSYRFSDKSHVASLAEDIRTRGYKPTKPVVLTRYDDRAIVTDGNHRTHATATAGIKKVPVEVRRVAGKAPADQPRAFQIIDGVRGAAQRAGYRRRAEDTTWISRKAAKAVKPTSVRGKINTAVGDAGAKRAKTVKPPLNPKAYYAANARMIGTGAVVGGLGAAATRKKEKS